MSTPCTALVPRASQSTNIHGVLLLISPALSPRSAGQGQNYDAPACAAQAGATSGSGSQARTGHGRNPRGCLPPTLPLSWRARWMGRQWSSGTSRPSWNREGWARSGPSGLAEAQRKPFGLITRCHQRARREYGGLLEKCSRSPNPYSPGHGYGRRRHDAERPDLRAPVDECMAFRRQPGGSCLRSANSTYRLCSDRFQCSAVCSGV